MAYAAVTSLSHTINRFLKSSDDIEIVQNSTPEMIKLLEEEFASLAEVLEELDCNTKRFSSSKRLNALDAQIRDAVFKLEDLVESHLLHQFVSLSENYIHHQHPLVFSLDIEELKQDIDSLTETVNKLKAEYVYELSSSSNNLPMYKEEEEEEEDDDGVIVESEPRMFGIEANRLFMKIKDMLLKDQQFCRQFALYGMAGIGKTRLARKVFEDPSVSSHFDCRAFVTVGPQYQLEHVLVDILKQLDPSIIHDEDIIMLLHGDEQEKLCGLERRLNEYLKYRRYLIVLDDAWDDKIIDMKWFSDKDYGSCTFVTSRLGSIARHLPRWEIPFLNKKESWDLLCAKLFGDQDSSLCTPQLERAGKKIAENCEGLPLTIVTVANILSKHAITPEYLNEVAANKQHSIYKEAYAKMHKVLLPSYYNLPQYLRISFLYMGVFPQNYEIPCSKLHMLWMGEGFIQCSMYRVDKFHFRSLLNDSVLIVHSTATTDGTQMTCKTVSLHSSFWYVCKKEAGKSKFFHSCTTLDDCLAQGIETQRRLCIYNPVLFAIKDAFDKMASVSAARSLLCTGQYHQYPVPVCFGLGLLRVLHALTIHFYEFPMEVLKLIHLTYLALTCDGDLPASISKLWNLVYLIVNRHLSIKSSASYLPVEIWGMKNLEHLQVMGSDLPEPPQGSHSMLLKLSKLLDVSPHSCTEAILRRVPNLTKLGIRIELSPDDDDDVHQPLGCFNNFRSMRILRSFKCVVVNPRMMFDVAAPPPIPLPVFPRYLHKLTLSGLGYPWEEMRKISSLPKLWVLKLLSYAFRGPKWDIQDHEFPKLQFLVIEETDLVQWTAKVDYNIPRLISLSIKHCYKLKEMPMCLNYRYLKKIEVVDCNPLVMSNIKEGCKREHNNEVVLSVRSSWDEQN